MAVISASRRSDIPAFHADWFLSRIREGYFDRVNPFNRRQASRVSLEPESVDAIVFWSKNPRPILRHLAELDRRGYAYYFQFTLNPYGADFEPGLPSLQERIDTFLYLSEMVGQKRVIWRYDPLILSNMTSVDWHLEKLQLLADALKGATSRLVISFLDFYGSGVKRLDRLRQERGIVCRDIALKGKEGELERLSAGIGAVGASHGLCVSSCAEELDLAHFGISHGCCVDGDLVRELSGSLERFTRDKGQRPACRCVKSVDMGTYGSCGYGCVYCYARRS